MKHKQTAGSTIGDFPLKMQFEKTKEKFYGFLGFIHRVIITAILSLKSVEVLPH